MSIERTTTDHDEIREWVEARGGKPVAVKRADHVAEPGGLRIDFPSLSGGDAFEEISWDEWFQQFEEENLAAVCEDAAESLETVGTLKLVERSDETTWSFERER